LASPIVARNGGFSNYVIAPEERVLPHPNVDREGYRRALLRKTLLLMGPWPKIVAPEPVRPSDQCYSSADSVLLSANRVIESRAVQFDRMLASCMLSTHPPPNTYR